MRQKTQRQTKRRAAYLSAVDAVSWTMGDLVDPSPTEPGWGAKLLINEEDDDWMDDSSRPEADLLDSFASIDGEEDHGATLGGSDSDPDSTGNPRGNKMPWTRNEDQIIENGVQRFGYRWSRINQMLPSKRSDDAVRNRWHRLARKRHIAEQQAPTGGAHCSRGQIAANRKRRSGPYDDLGLGPLLPDGEDPHGLQEEEQATDTPEQDPPDKHKYGDMRACY